MAAIPIPMLHELEDPHHQPEDYQRHIEAYLAKIFNSTFTGVVDHSGQQDKEKSPLGMLLKELHELVESERACTYEAEDVLQKIIDIRCLDKPEEMKTKMKEDYHRFLKKPKQNETRRSERAKK